jgi:catechol 2,3-dioxygenase-like lactoylglutathione lyase family enzyme
MSGLFQRVTIRVSEPAASEGFYAAVLATIGIERTHSGSDFGTWRDFALAAADAAHPPTRRLHIGFAAPSREHVDQFWRVGTAAGYPDDGPPGPRPQYSEDYYGAFLLDPDGNSAEAVHHGSLPAGAAIDHLWIRVGDLDATRRFYESIAPEAGLRVDQPTPDRVRCRAAPQSARGLGSFSLLPGRPTENLHMAFAATGGEAEESRRSVRDPDGNCVELNFARARS